MFTRTKGIVLPIFAAGVMLAGCSSGDQAHTAMPSMSSGTSVPAPAAAHNQADITFAQQMIPHHQQAVEMAMVARSHTGNQRILDLADQIQRAQEPEIQTMTAWLQTWGAPAPTSAMGQDGMSGMDHGSMPGSMSADDMAKLSAAKDTEFDRLWLQMMVSHHQGAIDMANTELRQGSSGDAKQLAQHIIDAQQAEITTMNGLLGQL
jgi:uncharacterized protein (DUF305 family)